MKRTELRSSKGKKLYAVRKSNGRFSDIQTYKRAHSADMKRTSKAEKRSKLISYISVFYLEAQANYNIAWTRLWKKIDALKLFSVLALLCLAGTVQAQIKLIDFAHPQIVTGVFADFHGNSDAGAALGLVTFGNWVPVMIGGTLGKGLGGPSAAIGTGINLLPSIQVLAGGALEILFPDPNVFTNLKINLLPPTGTGSPDITMSCGPAFSYVFTDGLKGSGSWTLFYGGSWHF